MTIEAPSTRLLPLDAPQLTNANCVEFDTELHSSLPDIRHVTYPHAFSALARSAYTLFVTPEHEKLHQIVENGSMNGPHQPLQPSLEDTVRQLHGETLAKANLLRPSPVDGARLVHLGGILMQFADYLPPKFQNSVRVPYENIAGLHTAITDRAAKNGPLGYAEQLEAALANTDGDLVDSLWQLFITSRLHARWLDGKIIDNMPDYTNSEKVELMQEWRASIAACKEPLPSRAQDPNGDGYYTWTHALAKVAYSLTPGRESHTSKAIVAVFHKGTNLMHKIVHTINKQGVESDHSLAAAYGNTIGQVCVDAVRRSQTNVRR